MSKNANKLCIIILPWGKHCYKHLPMGVANYPSNFQYNMNDLFHGFKYIRAYIDEHLVLTKGDWTDHLQKLELTLNKLKLKGLKCNIEDLFFGNT